MQSVKLIKCNLVTVRKKEKKTIMKSILIAMCSVMLLMSCKNEAQTTVSPSSKTMKKENIYQFKVTDLSGNTFDFGSLKGKKILIVNTASECGYTKQYEGLETIYKEYKDKNFVIVGFPANNFGGQEPGSNQEIATFCKQNYGVTFPMMEKISVKGDDMNAVYKFLTEKSKNGLEDSEVQWNFQKYLIDENGELVKVLLSKVKPTDPEIVNWING